MPPGAADPFAQPSLSAALPRYHAGRKLFAGRYTLKRKLGAGGMGEVWLAQDNELAVDRALKFPPPQIAADQRAIAMLKRETLAGVELAHDGIVRIFDFATEPEEHESAVVMEFIDGHSLADLQARRLEETGDAFFEPHEITPWLAEIAVALDYAHGKGRVHRDLKPHNIMVAAADGRVKIMDFGISRRIGDSFTQLTGQDSSGTLAYCSPQQASGERFSAADDIYGLGATLYDLLTGSPPFTGLGLREQVLQKPPVGLNERRRDLVAEGGNTSVGAPIPAAWEQTVLNCLAKDPTLRPASAAVLVAACKQYSPKQNEAEAASLGGFKEQKPCAAPQTIPPPLRSSSSRTAPPTRPAGLPSAKGIKPRLLVLLGVAIGGMFVIMAVLAAAYYTQARFEESVARKETQQFVTILKSAISNYLIEYSKMPVPSSVEETQEWLTDGSTQLMNILIGLEDVGRSNPRLYKFADFPAAKDGRRGLVMDPLPAKLLDAWGNPFHVLMDTDYDDQIRNPDVRNGDPAIAMPSGKNAPEFLHTQIAIYSCGKDGQPQTADDIVSWR